MIVVKNKQPDTLKDFQIKRNESDKGIYDSDVVLDFDYWEPIARTPNK
jgi:hypothetical protein